MYKILEQINQPNDIKNISKDDYPELAKEIRKCLIKNVSHTGGHLASNLGVVELTMALHLCLDFPEDKLIWDVGHQSYVHKMLTGRWRQMPTLRQYGGLSGFPKLSESDTDSFETGHASTSVSSALGFAFASKIQNEDNKIFAVIGDGSASGGLFFEALNNAVSLKSNMVIVLNDNNMSISKNVGGMSKYLTKIRTASQYKNLKSNIETALRKVPYFGEDVIEKIRKSKSSLKSLLIPGMLFEDMGLTYIGPIDGHNIDEMVDTFRDAMRLDAPVLVHVKTKKGRGYKLAENNPSLFHGVEPFYFRTGELRGSCEKKDSYTKIFGDKLCEIASKNEKVVAVCAAMPLGTGLSSFSQKFKDRFFDVGIAEEHAVTFSAALAAGGMTPVVAIYSTFLQRSYDQILHDVCKNGYHVVFALDRSGIVGADGETHQGIYDISYLSTIPGLTVMAPKNRYEFEQMLEYAVNDFDGPIAVRYPRGEVYDGLEDHDEPIRQGKAEIIIREDKKTKKDAKKILILALGNMVECACGMYDELKKDGHAVTIVNMRFAKPLDTDLIDELAAENSVIVTMEENSLNGGMSEYVAAHLSWSGLGKKICIPVSLPDTYIEHGSQCLLRDEYGLTPKKAVELIRSRLK